jgi:hypothetical protein
MLVLAHAFGARYELPLPLYLFVVGGALVVIASFLLVARRAVAPADAGANVPDGAHVQPLLPFWGALSVLWLAFLVWCGLAGSQEVPENIIATVFWIYVWVAVPLSCAVIGDWTQAVNPFAFLAKLADNPGLRRALLGGPEPVPWPDRLGWWPAAVLFFVGVLAELIYNLTSTIPHVTAAALAVYAGLSAFMGLLFGREWLRRGELFTVLFDTWGRLGWFRFGARGRRGLFGGLERPFAAVPSRVVFVLLMLLNVNFDGLLSTPQWANVLHDLPSSWGISAQHGFDVGSFVAMALVLGLLFLVFAHGAAVAGEHRTRPLASLTGLLPSVLPIAYGYLFSHYLEYLLVNGQLLIPLIGNPPGLPSWPLTLPYPFDDSYEVHAKFLPSAFYWYVSVAVIIAVHVAAVLLAHRHLSRTGADERLRLRSEYPWLVAMVGYTCLSLWLLAQPLTKETSTTSESQSLRPPPVVAVAMPAAPPVAARSSVWQR